MRKGFLTISIVLNTGLLFAQRPPLDINSLDQWETVGNPSVSNNGRYVTYTIFNRPAGNNTLVLGATMGSWRKEIPGALYCEISQDSRHAVCLKSGDSLEVIELGKSSSQYIPNVRSFKLPKDGNSGWCAYQLKTVSGELVLFHLTTGEKRVFSSVKDYLLNSDASMMVVQTALKRDGLEETLYWIDIGRRSRKIIWQGDNIGSICFDKSGTRIAFSSVKVQGEATISLYYYYEAGRDSAMRLISDDLLGEKDLLKLGSIQGFSNDGNRLFVRLREKKLSTVRPEAVKVDVWSYMDPKLQSQQLKELNPGDYLAVVDIRNHRIIRLEREYDQIPSLFPTPSSKRSDDFLLALNSRGDYSEWNWNPAALQKVFLVSARTGERVCINDERKVQGPAIYSYQLSPGGKYVVYYDVRERNYFSYEVLSGKIRNITESISADWTLYDNDHPDSSYSTYPVAGWIIGDTDVLIYDRFDIWKVSLMADGHPVNLTNGYGMRNSIVFRLAGDYRNTIINEKEKLVLSAFNRTNKNAGFYIKVLKNNDDPELLTMGPYNYDLPYSPIFSFLKARDAEVYIVKRESAVESPNFLWTTNFKDFGRLSDVRPERSYNWLTTELMTWRTFDGTISQGVLYKPQDFDPGRKYPLILYFYEKLSDELNLYHAPKVSTGRMEIPWFVSNGYLVFTPDIHYRVGMPGWSVYNSVVSAAKYMMGMPWVDSSRLGLQGHSWGGYETNYIVTQTNIFAAAMSASSVCDLISHYGALFLGQGNSLQSGYELGQTRIGATLWERPDLYIENSPVFQANKVTTPVLMMNNKEDPIVHFSQGVEFFTALRRLGKKVWMLQYDGEGHVILNNRAAKDYTIRVTQFFDHYLKGASAPKWMEQGVPARLKGEDDGLKINTNTIH